VPTGEKGSTTVTILGVDNVLVDVSDLNEAIAFYRDGLGLGLKFRLDERGTALFAIADESAGLLARVSANPVSGGMRLWLEVPDARAEVTALARRGIATAGDPFQTATGWTVELKDPLGNIVGLADYTLRPKLGRRPAASPPV
jgi:predicted enzyme related to lactoylglutathione lyase